MTKCFTTLEVERYNLGTLMKKNNKNTKYYSLEEKKLLISKKDEL